MTLYTEKVACVRCSWIGWRIFYVVVGYYIENITIENGYLLVFVRVEMLLKYKYISDKPVIERGESNEHYFVNCAEVCVQS